MLRQDEDLEEMYREMARIIDDLVACYAIPHTRMSMRWRKPNVSEYREEVIGWLEDYARSFVRLPARGLPDREELPAFARRRLGEEIASIREGRHVAVERSYEDLFL